MDSLLSSVAEFISRNAMWAGLILGLVTFVESLVVIGAFIPATGLLVIAGTMIAAGILDPWNVILGCVIGASLGDAVSFAIGRRMGSGVLRHKWLRPHRRKVAWTRLYCARYGVASIFIGRFFGPLRAFVPTMVGVLRMRRRTFQIANVTSAIVWVLAMVIPGWLVGKGLHHLAEGHGKTVVIAVALVLVAGVLGVQRLMKARAAKKNRMLRGAVTGD
ncbi:membrane protein [Brevundimonas sp. GN22]|uniref:DedA family protein n=1 Tax=Brevundimonas pishanensis TaxID=2896315 RepID=UPI001FA6F196|nr:DedA family protein [Brevundimonas pishanensis]